MSVSGLCEICSRPAVEYTCDRCGKLVCARHFDEQAAVCVECAAQLGERDPGSDDSTDNPDGVDTYRF